MFASVMQSDAWASSLRVQIEVSSHRGAHPLFYAGEDGVSGSFLMDYASSPSVLAFFLMVSVAGS